MSPPPPFASAVALPADPRPASVRALCIVGFVLAGLALASPLFALAAAVTPPPSFGPPGSVAPAAAMQRAMYSGPLLRWTIGLTLANLAMAGWLLWASIAAWRLRDVGRRGLLAYAVVAIVCALAGGAINGLIVMPAGYAAMADAMAAAPTGGRPASPALPREFFVIAGVVVGGIGGLIGTVYPICLLVFLRRPHVVAAFAGAGVDRGSPAR